MQNRAIHYAAACCIGLLSIIALCASPEMMLRDPDTAWHLAAGDWIRAHGNVPLTDPWAFTTQGHPWVNLAWLWDVWMSALQEKFGWQGQMVVSAVCVGVTMAILYGICILRAGQGIAAFLAVFLVFVSNTPLVRPMWVSNVFIVGLFGLAQLIQHRGWNVKWWYVMPLIMPLWVNIHGGFVVAFFLLGVYGLQALINRQWNQVIHMALAGCVSIAALSISPFPFLEVVRVVTTMFTTPGLRFISEFQPTSLPWGFFFTMPFVPVFLFYALRKPMKLPFAEKILIFTLLVLSATAIRYWNFFFLFAAPVLAMYFAATFQSQPHRGNPTAMRLADALKTVCFLKYPGRSIVTSTVLTLLVLGWFFSPPAHRLFHFDRIAPYDGFQSAVAFLKKHYPDHRFINDYSASGPLVLLLQGDIKLFIDGRGETAYPREVVMAFDAMLNGEKEWDRMLDTYRINGVIAANYERSPLRLRFAHRRGWKQVFQDETASIYVKE